MRLLLAGILPFLAVVTADAAAPAPTASLNRTSIARPSSA